MIHFIVAPGHSYTFANLRRRGIRPGPSLRVWTYPRVFATPALPAGTWVFCDLERLSVWELRLAGEVAHVLRAAGPAVQVLNDPARAACRYELLLRLHAAGMNRFRAWRAEDGVPPARYPVFLRLESDHGMPVSSLIETSEDLSREIDVLRSRGVAMRGVLVIEYAAEPIAPSVFRKYSAYRIGSRIVADHMVHDVTWLAKYGDERAWTPERYADERLFVETNPHAEEIARAFEIGAIQYGRADYGVVAGTVQVWEINTNPYLPRGDVRKAPPDRVEATRLSRENRLAAIMALNEPRGQGVVSLDSDLLVRQRARHRWWRPGLMVRE